MLGIIKVGEFVVVEPGVVAQQGSDRRRTSGEERLGGHTRYLASLKFDQSPAVGHSTDSEKEG